MTVNHDLTEYYTHYDEDGRLASRHGSVEYHTTMRYIERYRKPGDRVLEIGAGTGRYSHALARMGHAVDAVELVEHNIEIFRRNTRPGERVTVTQGNALDLSGFAEGQYDITLLLGPLYHLSSDGDKRQALREAIRVTKPGGVIFAAYVIYDGCLLDEGFHRGNIPVADFFRGGQPIPALGNLFEMVRKEEIDALMRAFPDVERLHYVAADGCTRLMREAVDAMDEERFQQYLRYHFSICERADLVGVTNHALDIFRRLR